MSDQGRRRGDGEYAALRYVALGDSYTVGTSVERAERFPDQLSLREPRLELVANLGVNGYTTGDLIRDELPALPGHAPGFVTLLIGVNDVVQDIEMLRGIRASEIVEMSYISASDATTRFGTGYVNGLINVVTARVSKD